MKRPSQNFIESVCVCPDCGSSLDFSAQNGAHCNGCNSYFRQYKNAPVLLPKGNPLFQDSDYLNATKRDATPKAPATSKKRKLTQFVKNLIPSRSVNLERNRIFSELSKQSGEQPLSILVVGCGNQTQQLEKYFGNSPTRFMFCDIDKNADVDVFCDAHQLPLKSGSFDGLITTAVLEHVLYPEKAVSEMVRVLKLGGFIYSEVPFLQSVHEGAYDFTRYTMSGHRRLLEHFDEVDAGMVAGPATALLWAMSDLPRGLFTSPRLAQLATMVIRCLFFWVKYLDVLMKHNQKALDFSCATYYWGNKAESPVSPESIVEKYGVSSFSHV